MSKYIRFADYFRKVLEEDMPTGSAGVSGDGSGFSPDNSTSSDSYATGDARMSTVLGKKKDKKGVVVQSRLTKSEEAEELEDTVEVTLPIELAIIVHDLLMSVLYSEDYEHPPEEDAEYQGRKVTLNKPIIGDIKKFKVYVKDPKTGNVKKVNFGHGGSSAKRKTMRIRKSNPKARKSFRARHKCDQKKSKLSAGYWSCRKW
jgi:hypothetical protein